MIKQDYIMLIMNCKKYMKKSFYQKITWLRTVPSYIKYYHVIGDIDLKTEYKFDDTERILWVKTLDDYNSLPKKVISSYKAIQETFDFKYIFKTDDDQILAHTQFFDTIIGIINKKNPRPHYGGYIVDVPATHVSQYYKIHPELPNDLIIQKTKYCSGRFYFLSKEVVKDLITKREDINNEFFEDYAMGFHMDEKWKKTMIHISTNKYFADIENSDFYKMCETTK